MIFWDPKNINLASGLVVRLIRFAAFARQNLEKGAVRLQDLHLKRQDIVKPQQQNKTKHLRLAIFYQKIASDPATKKSAKNCCQAARRATLS